MPDATWRYQSEQSKIAVGAGGPLGLGLMQGKQKLLYLPEAHTDFIYAVVSEELGLIGSVGVLLGFIVILWRGLRATVLVPDDFGRYLALGITTMLVVQGFINISVVLGMMPTKGIPLPMISSGGSSLVSTLASLGKHGLKVQEGLMAELKLGQPEIAWHTVRDRIGEVGCFLGLVTGTLGKISMDVKLLMQTEVAEVFEPFHEGRGSSSTMPQKRNPIASLYIHSTAALVRQNTAALLEAAVADHERSTGPWEIEWIALPEIFLLAAGTLRQTRDVVEGLQVDAARMRANLDLTGGAIVSEQVMMGLGPHLGRQRAHDLVYDICREAATSGKPLVDLLAADKEISKHVGRKELEQMCDPANYLGLAGEMVDRVLAIEAASR